MDKETEDKIINNQYIIEKTIRIMRLGTHPLVDEMRSAALVALVKSATKHSKLSNTYTGKVNFAGFAYNAIRWSIIQVLRKNYPWTYEQRQFWKEHGFDKPKIIKIKKPRITHSIDVTKLTGPLTKEIRNQFKPKTIKKPLNKLIKLY
jgi:DNA-directed RNA polymerase specialized sigma subunit